MLLGNVEAVVVDLAAQEDVLMHRALLLNVVGVSCSSSISTLILSLNNVLYCSGIVQMKSTCCKTTEKKK